MNLKTLILLVFFSFFLINFVAIPINEVKANGMEKEIWGWWYDTSLSSATCEWLVDMHFTGLILIGEYMTVEDVTNVVSSLNSYELKWGMFVRPYSFSYEDYVTNFTAIKNRYSGISPSPQWYVLDDFQCYVNWTTYEDAINAANYVFTSDKWFANYNLRSYNPSHSYLPETYIKHIDYYDTPVVTINNLQSEIDNNFDHDTHGAMVWTLDELGCGWNTLTKNVLIQLYNVFVGTGCIRVSFWNFYPGQTNNNLMLNPDWWDFIKYLNSQFLEGKQTPLEEEPEVPFVYPTNGAFFRPFYPGFSRGTMGPWIDAWNTSAINREINIEGWNVSQLDLCIRWAIINFPPGPQAGYPPGITVYFSLDNGETYTEKRNFGTVTLAYERSWPGGFLEAVACYTFSSDDYYLFTPKTRIKIGFPLGFPSQYVCNYYWGSEQKPVPPYDFIDDYSNPPNWCYVQYATWFMVKYEEETIEYKGDTISFNFTETSERLEKAANMIVDTMHLSGASNEVVGPQFGRDSWIIIYSSQLAMIELIDLMQIFPNQTYLIPVKRFIVWMWAKQNLTDGSFPFILTDGDQHCWYNETRDSWYGYDKIDSFSACAISLMRKYYNATEDLDFINDNWNHILKAKEFIVDLMNTTYWLPVDGYHYHNDTGYVKSEMNWLHDCCEAYQGIKDYASLEGFRGNDTEETYWNTYADSIANGIRTHFWNETLGRYTGMFYMANATQNIVKVYNIITPVIYGIETNETRAILTTFDYVNWGILSGRYYELKWAEDYSVYNEYSTMGGMICSDFAELITKFGYCDVWMKTKFTEVSKFLFLNPIYPGGDLQNNNGFLDYVNLVNYTYAKDYARLIEGSAWFIDGFMQLGDLTDLYNYTAVELWQLNETLTLEAEDWQTKYQQFHMETGYTWNATESEFDEWVEWLKTDQSYVQWYDFMFLKYLLDEGLLGEEPWWEGWQWDDWDWLYVYAFPTFWLPIMFIFGMVGLSCTVGGPVYAYIKIKEGHYYEAFRTGMILFVVGIALTMAWLWH